MKLTEMPKIEAELLQAAIEVAKMEDIMYQKEQEYQEAYDNFKRAQQVLHQTQQLWLKGENGILPSVPAESAIIAVYNAPATS